MIKVTRTEKFLIAPALVLLTMLSCVTLWYLAPLTTGKDPAAEKMSMREGRIKRQFSVWDGSHRNLEKHIKSIMNNADSYVHVRTIRHLPMSLKLNEPDHFIVSTRFRGTNAFGAVMLNQVNAVVDLDGTVLEVTYFGPLKQISLP